MDFLASRRGFCSVGYAPGLLALLDVLPVWRALLGAPWAVRGGGQPCRGRLVVDFAAAAGRCETSIHHSIRDA